MMIVKKGKELDRCAWVQRKFILYLDVLSKIILNGADTDSTLIVTNQLYGNV